MLCIALFKQNVHRFNDAVSTKNMYRSNGTVSKAMCVYLCVRRRNLAFFKHNVHRFIELNNHLINELMWLARRYGVYLYEIIHAAWRVMAQGAAYANKVRQTHAQPSY
eukprot:COSAG06_NODE_613_length_13796_cov_45.631525_5_plen_108_part_00